MSEVTKEWLLKRGKEYVEGIMRERGYCQLMVFGHLANRDIVAYSLNDMWNGSDFMRDIAVAQMKADMKKRGVVAYLTAAEAWVKEVPVPDDMRGGSLDIEAMRRLAYADGVRAEDAANRQEVVFLSAGDATGTISAMYYLRRKKSGAFSHLEPDQTYADHAGMTGVVDGRLADLLLDKGRAH